MTSTLIPTVSVLTEIDISAFQDLRMSEGDAFLERAFTARERQTCLQRRRPDHGLAARYAAREGLSRACQEIGIEPPGSPEAAEIVHDAFGAPIFQLSGSFRDRAKRVLTDLSLAHDGALAYAVVVVQW